MTDWNHRTGFKDFHTELSGQGPVKMTSILLNGLGTSYHSFRPLAGD